MKRIYAIYGLFGVIFLACLLNGCGIINQERSRPEGTVSAETPEMATLASHTPEPAQPLDLTTRPQIWFSPLDPSPPDQSRPFYGSNFFDLFEYPEQWQNAAGRIQVFKLYGGWVAWKATHSDLERVVDFANQHGLALAFEAGPLTPPDACSGEVEGFAVNNEAARIVDKIKAAGGNIVYVDLEHPYDAATFYDTPDSCKMDPEAIAGNITPFIETVRNVFPEAQFGAVETAQHDLQHIIHWVEAYRSVMGEDLAYFHLDLNYGDPLWVEEAVQIESYLKDRGIEFGIFYRGEWDDRTGAEWIKRAEETMIEYEARGGGHPDHVIIQSWHPQPEQLLPETDPAAFTYLINRYFRDRTILKLNPASSDGSVLLRGELLNSNLDPLAGETVQFSMVPTLGAGLQYSYILEGTVPDGATEADVGYRVNLECDCSGPAELTLFEVSYQEGDLADNPIPNHDFSLGYGGWSAWGNGDRKLVRDEQSGGLNLKLKVTPEQGAALNSAKFPVTAGAPFRMTFLAQVSPVTSGSGYFNIIFDDYYQELRRFMEPILPATILIGEVITDEKGAFEFILADIPPDQVLLQAWYAGDQDFWPAQAEVIYPAE